MDRDPCVRVDLLVSVFAEQKLGLRLSAPYTGNDLAGATVDQLKASTQNAGAAPSFYWDESGLQNDAEAAARALLRTRGGGVTLCLLTQEYFCCPACVADLLAILKVLEHRTHLKPLLVSLGPNPNYLVNLPVVKHVVPELVARYKQGILPIHRVRLQSKKATAVAIAKFALNAWQRPDPLTLFGATSRESIFALAKSIPPDDLTPLRIVLKVPATCPNTKLDILDNALAKGTIFNYDNVDKLAYIPTVRGEGRPHDDHLRAAIAAYQNKWVLSQSWRWESLEGTLLQFRTKADTRIEEFNCKLAAKTTSTDALDVSSSISYGAGHRLLRPHREDLSPKLPRGDRTSLIRPDRRQRHILHNRLGVLGLVCTVVLVPCVFLLRRSIARSSMKAGQERYGKLTPRPRLLQGSEGQTRGERIESGPRIHVKASKRPMPELSGSRPFEASHVTNKLDRSSRTRPSPIKGTYDASSSPHTTREDVRRSPIGDGLSSFNPGACRSNCRTEDGHDTHSSPGSAPGDMRAGVSAPVRPQAHPKPSATKGNDDTLILANNVTGNLRGDTYIALLLKGLDKYNVSILHWWDGVLSITSVLVILLLLIQVAPSTSVLLRQYGTAAVVWTALPHVLSLTRAGAFGEGWGRVVQAVLLISSIAWSRSERRKRIFVMLAITGVLPTIRITLISASHLFVRIVRWAGPLSTITVSFLFLAHLGLVCVPTVLFCINILLDQIPGHAAKTLMLFSAALIAIRCLYGLLLFSVCLLR